MESVQVLKPVRILLRVLTLKLLEYSECSALELLHEG